MLNSKNSPILGTFWTVDDLITLTRASFWEPHTGEKGNLREWPMYDEIGVVKGSYSASISATHSASSFFT